jgi:hypothetical protein
MTKNDDYYAKFGKDIYKWSDLDVYLPAVDLDYELKCNNVVMAELAILSVLLKAGTPQRKIVLACITPDRFHRKSLTRFIFEKALEYLQQNETVPEEVMEKWVPEFSLQVYGEISSGRALSGNNFNLRLALSLNPTLNQFANAVEIICTRKDIKQQEKLIDSKNT